MLIQRNTQRKNSLNHLDSSKEAIKKYITLGEGMDFRQIAKVMSDKDYKMNHATARNQLLSAVEELLSNAISDMGLSVPADQIKELAKSQEVHEALQDVLYLAYEKAKKTKSL